MTTFTDIPIADNLHWTDVMSQVCSTAGVSQLLQLHLHCNKLQDSYCSLNVDLK